MRWKFSLHVTSRSTTSSNKKIIKKVTELEKLSVQVHMQSTQFMIFFLLQAQYKNVIKTNLRRSLAGPNSYPCLKRAVTLLKLSHAGRTDLAQC